MKVKRAVSSKAINEAYQLVNRDTKPRLINPKPEYSYVWVHNNHQLITYYLNLGYRLATKSDVQVEGLRPNAEGHWESGVDILMMAEKTVRDKLLEKQKLLQDLQLSKIKADFHNEAAKLEVDSFETEETEDGRIKIIKG